MPINIITPLSYGLNNFMIAKNQLSLVAHNRSHALSMNRPR